jgi:hypothetical protein
MFTFSILPSSGSTFIDSFSAITSLSAQEVFINWGDDNIFYDINIPHTYQMPGIYNTTLQSCSGNMYKTLNVVKYPYSTLQITSSASQLSAGCNVSFTVSLTSDDIENNKQTLLFNSLSSSSFGNVPTEFYSHLIPQWYFLDNTSTKVNSYELTMSALSANDQIIGYYGSADFIYHDDLPGVMALDVSVKDNQLCRDLLKIDQTFNKVVYELTPLSSYCIGFASDTGLTGNNQTSAYNIFRNNNIDHLILGGDNSYDDANISILSANLNVFNPYLSARDSEKYTLVVGNHDRDNGHLSAYNVLFPDFVPYEKKTVANGLIDFFKLDSGFTSDFVNLQYDGITVGSDQYNWFVKEVSNSKALLKFVWFHHPAFASNNSNNGRSQIVKEMDWKFEDFGISLVGNGHIHYTEFLEYLGVGIVNVSHTANSSNVPSYISPYQLYSSSTRAVALIYCYPTKYVVKIVSFNGTVLYSYEKILNTGSKIYTMEDLSAFSTVELSEYVGNFSVSATNLSPDDLFFENITVKSGS